MLEGGGVDVGRIGRANHREFQACMAIFEQVRLAIVVASSLSRNRQ